MRIVLLFSLIVIASPLASAQDGCPTRASWPTFAWPSKTAEYATSRPDQIAALEKYLFTLDGPDADRKGRRTDSLLIVQGGNVVYEKYARGWKQGQKHVGWSMSKTVTNALTAIAVHQGKISLDDSICKHRPDFPAEVCAIKVVNLLDFASGIDWKEIYENESNQLSSVLAMLYGQGHQDMALFTARHPRRDAPGTSYQYSTGESTLLVGVVGAPLGAAHGEEWPWKVLFDRIGMKRTTFERDQAGGFAGGSWVSAPPEDWARFGFLFLNDGCWNGERLFPKDWVKDATKVSEAIRNKRYEWDPGEVQGRMIWVNEKLPEAGQNERPWPDVPGDAYCARGHWGQRTCVVPSLDLVIVRLADDREREILDNNEFLKLAIAVGRAP